MSDDYDPRPTVPVAAFRLTDPGSSTISGTVLAIVVPDDTSDADAVTLYGVISWAKSKGLPDAFMQRMPELARRDPRIVREICDELAELGYPFTANDLRAYWRRARDR